MLPYKQRRDVPSVPTRSTNRPAYSLVVRGRDGRPRVERFDDAGAYKARLAALDAPAPGGISFDEIVDLLDS